MQPLQCQPSLQMMDFMASQDRGKRAGWLPCSRCDASQVCDQCVLFACGVGNQVACVAELEFYHSRHAM